MYDVFISFKNKDDKGNPTLDSKIAKNLYDYLVKKGHEVFFSVQTLEVLGKSDYAKAINNALEKSLILIVIGTCNLNSF